MQINITALTTIILLLPLLYLLLASPAFLFVRLDIPQVAYLLRSMFFGYFLALLAMALIAASLNALNGGLSQALGLALLSGLVLLLRGWMMRRFDPLVMQAEAGNATAATGLRRLHLLGMAANAVMLGTVILCIPLLAVAA